MNKWLNKYQQGGKAPIYVSDPNDPRLRAYQDSLKAYQGSPDFAPGDLAIGMKIHQGIPSREAFRDDRGYKEWNDVLAKYPNVKPYAYTYVKDQVSKDYPNGEAPWLPLFQKPVQPIKLKPREKINIPQLPISQPQQLPIQNTPEQLPYTQIEPLSIYPHTYGVGTYGNPNTIDGVREPNARTYQTGGKLSTTGYKSNSKDKNAPWLTIPSGNITMQNVPHPIMAYPNNDQPTLMQPQQEYLFPNSSRVVEVPVKKNGGWLEQYQQGGPIQYTNMNTHMAPNVIPMAEQYNSLRAAIEQGQNNQSIMKAGPNNYNLPPGELRRQQIVDEQTAQQMKERHAMDKLDDDTRNVRGLAEKIIDAGTIAEGVGMLGRGVAKGLSRFIPERPLPASWNPASYTKANPTGTTGMPYQTEVTPLTKEQQILQNHGVNPREIDKPKWEQIPVDDPRWDSKYPKNESHISMGHWDPTTTNPWSDANIDKSKGKTLIPNYENARARGLITIPPTSELRKRSINPMSESPNPMIMVPNPLGKGEVFEQGVTSKYIPRKIGENELRDQVIGDYSAINPATKYDRPNNGLWYIDFFSWF